MPEFQNSIGDLKKFFSKDDEPMTIAEFKAEWDQLTEEEKVWFKQQELEK